MEELYPKLSDSLKKVVEIVEVEDQLKIELRVKNTGGFRVSNGGKRDDKNIWWSIPGYHNGSNRG